VGKSDSTVTVRRVRVGITEADLTSIQGEVSAREQVVTDGADRLREAAKVDVITAATKDRGADKTSTRERASEAPGVSAPASSAGEGGERPRWMDRLPPELVEKVKAMSPEDRRAFLQKMREQRRAEGQ
jgi:multidrug efflux system membrane fusion protein